LTLNHYLGGIEEWLNRHEPEENRFFFHPDHLGSSSFITDADGEGYQHLQYMPFGETSVSQKISWWSTPYQFTGKEKDDETGYNYFGARYYNSDLSVWLSVDPMAGLFPAYSGYQYVRSNPMNRIDRWGLYDDPAAAARDRRIAVGLYGDDRVGEVFNNGTNAKPDYRFHIYAKHRHKLNMTPGNGKCGVMVYMPEASIANSNDLNAYIQTGGGTGWATYVSMGATIMSEMYWSSYYNTWMGKNFKLYYHSWGGNGWTGGKNKYAKKNHNILKWGGRILGLYGLYNIGEQMIDDEISIERGIVEGSVNIASSWGTIYGAAFGIGWEGGRSITQTTLYQETKFNYWHNRMEKQIGPPSMYNEHLWAEFYKNYAR
jgi:RHS repeat-associated protein